MRKVTKLFGVSLLSSLPMLSIASLSTNEISVVENLNQTNYLNSETNYELKEMSYDKIKPIYFGLKTKAVGKAWGGGAHSINSDGDDNTVSINLSEYGGWDGMVGKFTGFEINFFAEYYFQKGKSFNWSTYNREKKPVKKTMDFRFEDSSDMGEFREITKKTSDKGGYDWGNYFKVEVKASNDYDRNLEITLKYTVAAYGVGNNWYWTAGTAGAEYLTFKKRPSVII